MNATRVVLARDRAPGLSPVRLVFRALCAVAPALAAKVAERIWFTPPRPPLPPASRAFLITGERMELAVAERRVVAWSWGEGPAVILMHGWGGYGAQLENFVAPLQRAGFRAVLFDAPGHGASGASRLGRGRTTFFDFSDGLRVLADRVGPVQGLVAHSGGCTAAGWALRGGWTVPSAVFIAPMASPLVYQRMFQDALGLTDNVLRRFAANVERLLGFQWEELEMTNVPGVVTVPPVLVVHDREDRETSWKEGASIVETWPDAEMMTTSGLGHRRVLRDEAVVAAAIAFIGRDRS
jgi:predicted alpha/beta hydrolase family esterase